MLTFRFTGVNGEMIEEEMLAAGMVGKQVQFVFSEEWDGLRKVAVYKAGDLCCATVDVETVDTIPAEVLSRSLQRLQVGIYGISEDGSVVTPTIYATGPFIHISAVMGEDPCFDPENTFWIKLEEAIGELAELTTEEKTSLVLAINETVSRINALAAETAVLEEESGALRETTASLEDRTAALEEKAVRVTAQSFTKAQQAQARKNIGAVCAEELPAPGLDENAAKLLVTILQNGVYTADQYENILRLSEAICGTVLYGVESTLENVTMDNSKTLLAENDSYTAALTVADGYELETVNVTMGGKDVTGQVYADGVITIAEVTADVVILAAAVKKKTVFIEDILMGFTTSFVSGAGLQVASGENYNARATVAPIGQYLEKGKTYCFGIGDAVAGNYYFGVQIMTTAEPGLTFAGTKDQVVYFNSVTARPVDTGWMQSDYQYTATEDNLIFTMNFKHGTKITFDSTDYEALKANAFVEEVA